MKDRPTLKGAAIIAALLLPTAIIAQDEQGEPTTMPSPQKGTPTTGSVGYAPIYKPPLGGGRQGRVEGGARGAPDRAVLLAVLTPDEPGLTTKEQPSLYWYISQPTTFPIEVTVTENQAVKPLLEARITSPSQAGIQRIRLTDYGVRLKTGSLYRWYIALVPDSTRSKDILAGGLIERIELAEALRARLNQASTAELPFVYADEGIWYDALSSISDTIDADPNNSNLRAQRASLLEQVRLQEIADFDRQAAR
jgi:Domain of Unknown Function (DUF928)